MIIFFVIWYYLWKRGKSFFISLDFKEFVVVVEERGDNFVRIKVIYLCNLLGVVGGGGIFLVKIKLKENMFILINLSVRIVIIFYWFFFLRRGECLFIFGYKDFI